MGDVAPDCSGIQPRQVALQRCHRVFQEVGRNIDPHKTRRPDGLAQGAGLSAASSAQFDQDAAGTHRTGNGRRVVPHQRIFGAGGVVLGQLGDGLEQL